MFDERRIKKSASLNVPIPDYTANLDKGIKGIKIGIPTYDMEGLEPDVEKLFNSGGTKLTEMGAEIRGITMPELAMSTFAGFVISSTEAATFNYESLQMHNRKARKGEDLFLDFTNYFVGIPCSFFRSEPIWLQSEW